MIASLYQSGSVCITKVRDHQRGQATIGGVELQGTAEDAELAEERRAKVFLCVLCQLCVLCGSHSIKLSREEPLPGANRRQITTLSPVARRGRCVRSAPTSDQGARSCAPRARCSALQ